MNEIQMHTLCERARQFVEEGKLLHALQIYTRVVNAAPELEGPYLQMAQIYLEWDRPDQAEEILRRGHASNPGNPVFLIGLGDLHVGQRKFARAISWYTKLNGRHLSRVSMNLGMAYLQVGNRRRAEVMLRRAMTRDGCSPKAFEALGRMMIDRNSFADAIRVLQQGARVHPFNSAVHQLLGVAYMRIDAWKKALDALVLAVDLDPQNAHAWQLCGDALIPLGRLEEAEAYLQKAMLMSPDSPDIHTSVGFLWLRRGDVARAEEAFQRALMLAPQHRRALHGRTQLRFHAGASGRGKRHLSS